MDRLIFLFPLDIAITCTINMDLYNHNCKRDSKKSLIINNDKYYIQGETTVYLIYLNKTWQFSHFEDDAHI